MLNDLIKAVAKKANISEPIAQIAVNTVLNSLKDKLPPSASTALNALVGSGSSGSAKSNNPLGDLGNIAGTLGGLLGKK